MILLFKCVVFTHFFFHFKLLSHYVFYLSYLFWLWQFLFFLFFRIFRYYGIHAYTRAQLKSWPIRSFFVSQLLLVNVHPLPSYLSPLWHHRESMCCALSSQALAPLLLWIVHQFLSRNVKEREKKGATPWNMNWIDAALDCEPFSSERFKKQLTKRLELIDLQPVGGSGLQCWHFICFAVLCSGTMMLQVGRCDWLVSW